MKNINKILIFSIFVLLLVTGCNKEQNQNKNNNDKVNDDNSKEIIENQEESQEIDKIKEQIDSMTLEEKLGQLLIVGFEGTKINEDTTSLIEELKVGGIIFFKRNIENGEQVLELTNGLKSLNKNNKISLFVSIDEEGGQVSRLPKEYERLPEARKIGDLNNEDTSFKYGELLGLRLNSLGFNLDYAPVMDINSNPDNPVIGNRAFGSTPELVSKHGIQIIKGLKSQNIINSIKHFPGHGDTSTDSHINLPIINKTVEEMREFEFIPFARSIEEGVDMVMVAHILFPEIDKKNPSTMSKQIINGLLREELEFEGVVISDDLTMGAITENYSLEEATLKFFQSGGDIALICHGVDNPKKVINYIKSSIKSGDISMEDINHKLYRILSVKDKYNLKDENINIGDLENINIKTREILEKMR